MSSKKIRIAVAGVGGRGKWAAFSLNEHPDYELVALVDLLPERSDLVLEKMQRPDLPKFTDIHACLDACELDAVAVLTPDGTHADLVVPALERGLHVFVEKPLDVTAERMDAIIAADKAAGGRTFVGFNLRFAPVYVKAKELIERGEVGRVLSIQADEFYNAGRTYFRRWNRLRSMGGGLWITKASHDFDLLYWFAGADPVLVYASAFLDHFKPREDAAMYCRDCKIAEDCHDRYDLFMAPEKTQTQLYAITEKVTGQKPDLCLYNSDKDTFDHGVAAVTFANNVTAVYTCNVVSGFSGRRLRVSGTKGTIDGELGADKITLTRRDPSDVEEVEVVSGEGGHGGADTHLFESFKQFCRGEPARVIGPAEASVAVRIGLAATRSGDTAQAVPMA